jgi:N-acetylneuraminate synthase
MENKSHTLVIAEAGVNHNGQIDLAHKLVETAAKAGADIVKFQTFSAARLVTRNAKKAAYQIANMQNDSGLKNDSQFDMLKSLELLPEQHRPLMETCAKNKIEFLSTPFDIEAARFLVHDLGLKLLKVSSGDLTNAQLLLEMARLQVPLILSTGMATMAEIEAALGVVAFGYLGASERPSKAAFQNAYSSDQGQKVLRERVTVLHCTTEYPAPLEDVNLSAMATIRSKFGLTTGYSDHTSGIVVSQAAVAMGASVIEKHFTLDRKLEGPDHKASLEPNELNDMIRGIREIEKSRGDGVKRPMPSEIPNIVVARKSLFAAQAVKAGEAWTSENLTAKRPGHGISAIDYWDWIGTKAKRDYQEDELIQ